MQIKKKTLATIIAIFAIIVVVLLAILLFNAYGRKNPTIIKPPETTITESSTQPTTEPDDVPTKPTDDEVSTPPTEDEPDETFPSVETDPDDRDDPIDQPSDPTDPSIIPTGPDGIDTSEPTTPTIPVVDPTDDDDYNMGLGGILEGLKITDVIKNINLYGHPMLLEDETAYEEAAREILTDRYEIPELGISILTPNSESPYVKRDSDHIRSFHAGSLVNTPNPDEFEWSITPSEALQFDHCICIIVGDKTETNEQNLEALINILPLMKEEMNGIIMSPAVSTNEISPEGLGIIEKAGIEILRCDILADVTSNSESEQYQYMATYTFSRNGVPCSIIGYVYGKENDVELIHTLRGMMREMIDSIQLL